MSENNEANNIEYRLSKLETNFERMDGKLDTISDNVIKLSTQFDSVRPGSSPMCILHDNKFTTLTEDVSELKITVQSHSKKLWMYAGIASVIIFLISQVAVPLVLQHLNEDKQRTEQIESSVFIFTNNRPYLIASNEEET